MPCAYLLYRPQDRNAMRREVTIDQMGSAKIESRNIVEMVMIEMKRHNGEATISRSDTNICYEVATWSARIIVLVFPERLKFGIS